MALQAPLSMGFSRQEYWSGLPCPRPGIFPDSWIEPGSLALQADSTAQLPDSLVVPQKVKNRLRDCLMAGPGGC